MKNNEFYSTKYNGINCLLLYFLEDTYYSNRGDKDTILRFIKDMPSKSIMRTISQGKKMLGLKEFPYKFIQHTANKYPFDKSHESTAKDYYNWIKWIVEELEKEAKNQGKLI